MRTRPRFHRLQQASFLLGVMLLAGWSGSFYESHGFQALESRRLDAARRATVEATSPGPSGAEAANSGREQGDVLGRIEIPRLGIRAIVAEGTDNGTLELAVGHVASTAQPGSPGNCALAGHRDTFFRGLGEVREDDLIHIVTPERTLTYQVEWSLVVEPRRVDLLDSTETRALTLVTCYPFKFIGRAPKRFVVRARQVESVASRPDPSMDP